MILVKNQEFFTKIENINNGISTTTPQIPLDR
jgi:hypothetical protein